MSPIPSPGVKTAPTPGVKPNTLPPVGTAAASDPVPIETFGPFTHTAICTWQHVVDFPIPAGATYATMTIETGPGNNNLGLDWGVGTDRGYWVNGPGVPLAWNSSLTNTYNFPAGSTRLGVDDKVWWGWCGGGDAGTVTYSGTFWAAGAPVATMNALPPSNANPLTVSWSGSGGAGGIASYTLWYQIGEAPPDVLTDVDGNTTRLGVWVADNTQYRFAVEATDALGQVSDRSAWVSTRTALPPMSTTGDDDPDLFDGAAEAPCLPTSDPNDPDGSFVRRLLMSQALCGATRVELQWRDTTPRSPLTNLLCPGTVLPLLQGLPGMALLPMTSRECVDLGGPDMLTAGNGRGEDLEAQADAARDLIIEYTNARTGISDAAKQAIAAGARAIANRARAALASGRYGEARGLVKAAQRLARMAKPNSGVTLDEVEAFVRTASGETGYIDGALGGMTEGGSPVKVVLETKFWRQTTLSSTRSFNALARQISKYMEAKPTHKVLLEFTKTSTNAITETEAQIGQRLVARGIDSARLMVHIVEDVTAAPPTTFIPVPPVP